MKNNGNWMLILLLFIFLSSCDKEEKNDNQSLIGKWTYSADYSKTFDFKNSTDVLINGQEYLYEILADSIRFSYNGGLIMAIMRPSKHRFEKLSDTDYLMIEGLNRLQFFNGNEGENILLRGIIPNDFVGYWVNIGQNDTLIFLTNERIERPHGHYNDWLEYSFSSGSLRVTYSGPDKILMPEINFGYDFKGDTLLINYHQSYYPNFTIGLKKYLRK